MVTSGRTGVDAGLMAALPNLGAVVNFGVGYDTTDVDAAAERGVAVSNTPDVLTDCVADTAVGLMIDTMRQFSSADRYVRAGRWPVDGNVSADAPGQQHASRNHRARPHRWRNREAAQRLRLHDLLPQPEPGRRLRRTRTCRRRWNWRSGVDVLVVAAAGGVGHAEAGRAATSSTHWAPTGISINIARGSVVDEAALVEALDAGRLAGAGLDVFADEPNVPEALLSMDNVVVLPHVGSGTVQTRAAMEALTLRNLDSFLASGELVTPVPMPAAASG